LPQSSRERIIARRKLKRRYTRDGEPGLVPQPGTISLFVRDLFGLAKRWRSAVIREIKPPSESAVAELRLGLTVTSLYTLVSLGLILVFT
jgi:hypothetical protein